MEIKITITVDAEHAENTENGTIALRGLRFPGTNLNIQHYLNDQELQQTMATLQTTINQQTLAKAARIANGEAFRAIAKEVQQDALREGQTQRGFR